MLNIADAFPRSLFLSVALSFFTLTSKLAGFIVFKSACFTHDMLALSTLFGSSCLNRYWHAGKDDLRIVKCHHLLIIPAGSRLDWSWLAVVFVCKLSIFTSKRICRHHQMFLALFSEEMR